jgi:hypothetical protein
MYYHNTKYRFALPDGSPDGISGAIILASSMGQGQLLRRDMRKHPYLQHRLFDPQLYLATLDPLSARKSVCDLATWPWLGDPTISQYDSTTDGTMKDWREAHQDELLQRWPGAVPSEDADIRAAVRSAIVVQLDLGCEAIILPAPLATVHAENFEREAHWIDIGIEIAAEMRTSLPLLASVALSDHLLRGIEPAQNKLLHTIANQIASRGELTGAYIVIEQASENGYVCTSKDVLLGLLILIDDLTRGAGKRVLVNYMGSFGPICLAAGAAVFSTGYYLSQRRLKLSDFEDKEGRAYPRYMSARLLGDIGVDNDLRTAFQAVGEAILTDTPASSILNQAIRAGVRSNQVPEWAYKQTNITAAAAHYNWIMFEMGRQLPTSSAASRLEIVHRWLEGATRLSRQISDAGAAHSDIQHQQIWFAAFDKWLDHSGLRS